jgi:hypothetical protein
MGGLSRPVQEWLSSGAMFQRAQALGADQDHLVIASASGLVNPGHPSPPGTIALMALTGEQVPGQAARQLDQRRRSWRLVTRHEPSMRNYVRYMCLNPAISMRLLGPARPPGSASGPPRLSALRSRCSAAGTPASPNRSRITPDHRGSRIAVPVVRLLRENYHDHDVSAGAPELPPAVRSGVPCRKSRPPPEHKEDPEAVGLEVAEQLEPGSADEFGVADANTLGKLESADSAFRAGVCQKTVAQSFFMLMIVQPLLAARSSASSAPLV